MWGRGTGVRPTGGGPAPTPKGCQGHPPGEVGPCGEQERLGSSSPWPAHSTLSAVGCQLLLVTSRPWAWVPGTPPLTLHPHSQGLGFPAQHMGPLLTFLTPPPVIPFVTTLP